MGLCGERGCRCCFPAACNSDEKDICGDFVKFPVTFLLPRDINLLGGNKEGGNDAKEEEIWIIETAKNGNGRNCQRRL